MNDVTKDLLEARKGLCETGSVPPKPKAWEAGRSAIARAEAALAEPQPDADGWISTDIIDYVRDAYAFISSVSPAGLAEEAFRLPPSSTRAQRAFLQAVQSDPLGKRATNPRQDPGGQSEDGGDVTRQPDADGWIPWAGGECPLADGVWHRVKFRNGVVCLDDQASSWGWGETAGGFQIIAYRILRK